MYIVPAPLMRPLGLTLLSVICAPGRCSMHTRNKGRSFGEPACGKGMLKLPGRMLIVMVICGIACRLLGARPKSGTCLSESCGKPS